MCCREAVKQCAMAGSVQHQAIVEGGQGLLLQLSCTEVRGRAGKKRLAPVEDDVVSQMQLLAGSSIHL